MTVGTKSLLFGVHQFAWHPVTVWLAWVKLYRTWPTWRECVCILVHDWGYWGCEEMDGPQGPEHTALGADIANRLLDRYEELSPRQRWMARNNWGTASIDPAFRYYRLVRWHSRHLCARCGAEPSKLCWPDKLSMLYDPDWFYLLRARLSGEIAEYRTNADRRQFMPAAAPDRAWLRKLKQHLAVMAREKAAQSAAGS
jgi:hypothetical protein